jgi:PAS domain S-box-containing protein
VLLLVVLCASASGSSVRAQNGRHYTVLVVQLASDDPPEAIVNAARRELLFSKADRPVDYYREDLAIEGVDRDAVFLALRDSIRRKHEGRRFDVVIAHTTPARDFVLRFREELFPDSPIVFMSSDVPDAATRAAGAGMTGIDAGSGFRETLELALRLHPSTERVYLLAPRSGNYFDRLRSALAPFSERAQLIHLEAGSLPELLSTLRRLPSRSLLFHVSFAVEKATNRLTGDQVNSAIAEAATVPVYVTLDDQVGRGAIGGIVRTSRQTGLQEATLALRILAGERPQDIGVEPIRLVPMFDWRQLQRWGIETSLLPVSSEIRFREPTAWELYKWPILGIVAIIIFQTATIAGLVAQRARRRTIEKALLVSQERYALATSAGGVAVWDWSPETNRLYVDPELKAALGFEPQEIGDRVEDWSRLVHPDDLPIVKARVRGLDEDATTDQEAEYRMLHRDGTVRWFAAHASVISQNGRIVRVVGTSSDITDRKRAEQQLRDVQDQLAHVSRLTALGEFAASIAHEVRQPLTAIVSSARASLRFLSNGSVNEATGALSYVIDAGKRADEIIERNRELFRSHAARKEPVDMNSVVRDAVAMVRSRLQSSGVMLTSSLAEDLPMLEGDRIQLHQVLLNLIANAIDSMETTDASSRHLEIVTALNSSGGVQLSVRDSGVGLGAVDMRKLFTLAYTTKRTGTGVGLSITRSIIEAHDGRLWAEQNPDRGATFCFILPARVTPADARHEIAS